MSIGSASSLCHCTVGSIVYNNNPGVSIDDCETAGFMRWIGALWVWGKHAAILM